MAILVDELADLPGRRLLLAGDIREQAFCNRLIAETVREFGRIDILINNAGLGHKSLLSEIPADHIDTIFDTNINGLLFACQATISTYEKAGWVGKSSMCLRLSVSDRCRRAVFIAPAKRLSTSFPVRCEMELRKDNIVVSLLYPGLTATEFHEATLGGSRRRRIRGVSAEKVANATLKAIHKKKREIYVTRFDWIFTHLNRLFPRFLDAFVPIVWKGS